MDQSEQGPPPKPPRVEDSQMEPPTEPTPMVTDGTPSAHPALPGVEAFPPWDDAWAARASPPPSPRRNPTVTGQTTGDHPTPPADEAFPLPGDAWVSRAPAPPSPRPPGPPPPTSAPAEGGRTLWQIFWNEDEEEPVVNMVRDISGLEEQEINTVNQTVRIGQSNGEAVLFEKRPRALNSPRGGGASARGPRGAENGKIYKQKDFKEDEWESFDVTPRTRSGPSAVIGRFLRRSDSDGEMMLSAAPSRTQSLKVSLRWCCINCRHATFWQQYWWIPVVILVIIVLYVVVTLVIIKTLGG